MQAEGHDLGTGVVDDLTEDGSIVWIVFGGAEPRRMFLEEDAAPVHGAAADLDPLGRRLAIRCATSWSAAPIRRHRTAGSLGSRIGREYLETVFRTNGEQLLAACPTAVCGSPL